MTTGVWVLLGLLTGAGAGTPSGVPSPATLLPALPKFFDDYDGYKHRLVTTVVGLMIDNIQKGAYPLRMVSVRSAPALPRFTDAYDRQKMITLSRVVSHVIDELSFNAALPALPRFGKEYDGQAMRVWVKTVSHLIDNLQKGVYQ